MEEDQKPNLEFKIKAKMDYSPIHNRGMFAIEEIEKDELIEICPMVILGFRMRYHNDPKIRDYCFSQTCPCDDCKKHGGHYLMVLGYGQIYNHHDDNNARISFDLKNSLAFIHANKNIKKDEEVFVSYGENYFKSRKQNESTVDIFKQSS
jgi:SET domain-containing protein